MAGMAEGGPPVVRPGSPRIRQRRGLAQQRQAYDRHVVPETGRIFFQTAFSMPDPKSPTRVDFANGHRPPLLMIAGKQDHIAPASMNRANFGRYPQSRAMTDDRELDERSHWIIAQPGGQEVADLVRSWLADLTGMPWDLLTGPP